MDGTPMPTLHNLGLHRECAMHTGFADKLNAFV